MRWLILTSSTGTGHNMRADSLRQWAECVFGASVEVRIHHVLEKTHPIYSLGVGLYNTIQRWCPRMHHLYFNYLELASLHRSSAKILGRDSFVKLVTEWAPDRIISVHPHTNHGFFDLARRALPNRRTRCITYCGELSGGYGLSRHWVNPRADGFIGATDEICAASRSVGMPEKRIFNGGFLLRSSFYGAEARREREAEIMARELGFERSVFTILLSSGLAGAHNHIEILREIAALGHPLQVVALCGHRANTRRKVEAFARKHPHLKVRALAHTDRMLALKRLTSVVVARPGTGATSEAIQLGVPLIHNGIGGVMPQELITVRYCRIHACAYFGATAEEIVRHIRRMIQEPATLNRLRKNLAAARPAGRPEQIVHWIHDCP
ncbi:MAG: UDP-N-acetylglucosamine:LPS N-acetylglucosamine transferase [Rariglobus sp.]|jgi:processive 1,2-diacylglycerol beta-glucosyltransferase|nr:UDP-N-acetylglucosamine:LPS N-acetylglucosamine transferase [Rariglobus sp.]